MDNKNLLKGTMIYTLANIVTKMGSLIFLPIITRLLTPEKYGIINLLEPIATLAAVIFGLGIYNAQMKKYLSLKDNENELGSFLFSSVSMIFALGIIVFTILLTPFSKMLFSGFKNFEKIENSLIVITIAIAFLNCLNNLAISFFRMGKMYVKVALGSVIKLFLHYFLVIYFIKIMNLGVLGERLANLTAAIVLLLYCFRDYFGKFRLKFQGKYAHYALINGLPLIFIELTDQVINFSDRFVMERYVPLAVIGAYGLAFNGGRALGVITGAFINSWTPEFYEAMETDRHNPQITRSLENFLGLICFACILAQLFAAEGITLIFPENYRLAISYIPYILISIVLGSLVCLDYFFHFHEDSKYIFYFSLFAMIFNLAGNLIFMPMYREYAVYIGLWTTIIAFLLRAALEVAVIKKRYGIQFDYRKMLFYLAVILNPLVFYLADSHISWQKFCLKILYSVIAAKFLINKEMAQKIGKISKKIKIFR